jgi:hypothetical protein
MTATSILPQALPVSASADNRLALVVDRARDYAEAAQADNTRPYRVGWNDFTAYCVDNGFDALPATPQTVALYVTALAASAKLATIRLYLAAIAEKHRETGLDSPTAHEVVRRIVRASHG